MDYTTTMEGENSDYNAWRWEAYCKIYTIQVV